MVLALSTCSLMDKLEDTSLITNESSLADFTNFAVLSEHLHALYETFHAQEIQLETF